MDITWLASFIAAIISFFIIYILIGIFKPQAIRKSRILVSFLTAIFTLIFFSFLALILSQVSLIPSF